MQPQPQQGKKNINSNNIKLCKSELSDVVLPVVLPDIESPSWWEIPVGFGKASTMTWYDLMTNKPMPDGKPGRSYLHALAAWKEYPDIQSIAIEAIRLGREWEAMEFNEPPF
jgi:hypothetical protein